MAISSVVLGTSETTLKQAGASESIAILSIQFCNTSASNVSITMYGYASGGSAGDSTTIIKSYTIPSGDTLLWTANDKFVLENLDKLSAIASVATSITATINSFTL